MERDEVPHKLTIAISKEEHLAFKAYCAKKGVSVSKELRELIALRISAGVSKESRVRGVSDVEIETILMAYLSKVTDFAREEIASFAAGALEGDEPAEAEREKAAETEREDGAMSSSSELLDFDLDMIERLQG